MHFTVSTNIKAGSTDKCDSAFQEFNQMSSFMGQMAEDCYKGDVQFCSYARDFLPVLDEKLDKIRDNCG